MSTRLVVNADDLGLHPAIDEGIFRARRDGIVTSATVLVTGTTARAAIERARREKLALGLHLCLTTHLSPAAPLDDVRWLAPGGRFRKNWAEVARAWGLGMIPAEEIDRELRAQVVRARELGAQIDHLDGHQHLHLLPGVSGIVERIASEEGLPLRWPRERPTRAWLSRPRAAVKTALLTALAVAARGYGVQRVRGIGMFDSGVLDEGRLLELIRALPPGDHEIFCHVGYRVGSVPEDPEWRYGWDEELSAVCSAKVREEIEKRGIELTTYAALRT